MNVAFIIPTGMNAAIGGHAGDATPAAKLIAQTCDKILLNPNVVNASDINEMPENALYVEGSILDGFLRGEYKLEEVRSNRVLVAVNKPVQPDTINAVNAANMTIGMNASIVELDEPLQMFGYIENGSPRGSSVGVPSLIEQFKHVPRGFDALAIATEIQVQEDLALHYFKCGGPNPWGWIESQVSQTIATALRKPVAHAPVESNSTKENNELFNLPFTEVVHPRKAAEVISNCYLHCVLKGLHQAPRISENGIGWESIAALVTPHGCLGDAHRACMESGIPIISVNENTTSANLIVPNAIHVENYLEAAGVLMCMRSGMRPAMVRA